MSSCQAGKLLLPYNFFLLSIENELVGQQRQVKWTLAQHILNRRFCSIFPDITIFLKAALSDFL